MENLLSGSLTPAGLWGDYTYLPDVCFIAGIPGQSYSYRYDWFNSEDP